jgi:hypothetical protein
VKAYTGIDYTDNTSVQGIVSVASTFDEGLAEEQGKVVVAIVGQPCTHVSLELFVSLSSCQ